MSESPRVPSPFGVTVMPHGRSLAVPDGRTVLDAALAAGLNLPHSCKAGHCGSCRARLVSGAIEYPRGRPLGVSEDEAARGYVLLCQAHPRSDLVVEARVFASVAETVIKSLPCRIERMRRLAPDVMQVFLRLPAAEPLAFRAGQYVDVLLDGGRRRSFSIASAPHECGTLELHVRRAPGGGFTGRLFDEVGPGALLRIEGPIGQFTWHDSPRPALLVAGGTGFAPIKSMLRHVFERDSPERATLASGSRRELHLYWGARRPADLYEEALVLEWTRRHPGLRFTAVLSESLDDDATSGAAVAAGRSAAPHRRTGWVHDAVLADHPDLSAFDVYAAGPPAMIEAIRAGFPGRGLDPARLYFDSFDYAPRA